MADATEKQLKKVGEEFLMLLLEIYGKCIISDMFSIIIGMSAHNKVIRVC